MKIIIAPSKTQIFTIDLGSEYMANLSKKSRFLFLKLKLLTKNKLGKSLNIKKNLLDKTFNLYQKNFLLMPKCYAINCYKGVVFEQLDINNYNLKELDYLNKHLVILSAMYGVIEPSNIIYPYRLDMNNKIPNVNLYKYWQEEIDNHFKDESIIINLASDEYSKMLKNQKDKIINIEFVEGTKTNYKKIKSYNSKKARGMMLNYMIENRIENLEELQKYNLSESQYNKEISDNNTLRFLKITDTI
ncbi:MAG: YaaA family protein [Candidatus Izemoplasmatales bacterium]|nr:YaaA family protein [Candidatus Izemoplasmatales bacterium]